MTKQTKLTAINEINERNVEVMMGKAVCAYANLQRVIEYEELFVESGAVTHEQAEVAKARHASEHEATVRCLDLFVKENLYEIQQIVRACAEEMMRA